MHHDDLHVIMSILMPIFKEKTNLSQSSFDLWFGDLRLSFLDTNEAVFTAPTKLRKSVLEGRYLDLIKEILFDAIGFDVSVRIEALEDVFKKEVSDVSDNQESPEDKEEKREREEKIKRILSEEPPADGKSVLDEYTFDNFIEGSSNKFAKAVCLAVAREPARDFNPLFIHGNSGLGKTHLLCAIINYMKKNHPHLNIVYIKCEDFVNELVTAISNYSTNQFKEKYRGADVLLIDDIQFIAGKVSTQEEFFHTFSYLYESNKQIILTSDRPPNEIKPLEDRLLTRFEGGLIADIQPPSEELRIAIIKKKSSQLGMELPNELVDYMAQRLHENIRQIEGVLKKLHALHSYSGEVVTKESVERVISIVDPGNIPVDILINRIIGEVSSYYGVSVEDMKSKKKTDTVANARHIAIYIIRKLTDKSYKEIGNIFSRDHSTVMNSCDTVQTFIKTKKNTESDIKKIIKAVKG